MGKWGMGALVVTAVCALALQGCHRDRNDDAETQAAPPMTNTVEVTNTVTMTPAPVKPPAPVTPTISTGGGTAQIEEDAAAVGMTSRSGGAVQTSTTTTTVTTSHTASTDNS